MNYDEDKIDEYTLALLYLVTHERQEGLGARAWKGFDWDTLNRLHEKGYISNPVGKGKSVGMTEEGFLRAKTLFEQHFTKGTKTVPYQSSRRRQKNDGTKYPNGGGKKSSKMFGAPGVGQPYPCRSVKAKCQRDLSYYGGRVRSAATRWRGW